MNKLDNLSAYEEKMLSSEKCPLCGGDLWIISNWMSRDFDAPQREYCELNQEHIFSKPPRSNQYYQIGGPRLSEIIQTFDRE